MGMYTELNIGVRFKESMPNEVRDLLAAMVNPLMKHEQIVDVIPKSYRDHPLFKTERWSWMLQSAGSYYFDAKPFVKFEFDSIADSYFLTMVSNIKNYCDEWQKFLSFIGPFIDDDGYIGTYRYEESDFPTLLFCVDGEVKFVSPNVSVEEVN